MPRQRQRVVYCDCFDCVDRPQGPTLTPEQLTAATAVARQEPPPKALLIYATGVVLAADGATNLDSCTLPHCNLVVREGNLGLLAVRQRQEAAAAGLDPAVSELAQLLGVYADVCRQPPAGTAAADAAAGASAAEAQLPSLAARFKGMQAAFASSSFRARALAQRLGMEVVDRLSLAPGLGLGLGSGPAAASPQAAALAAEAAGVADAAGATAPGAAMEGRGGAAEAEAGPALGAKRSLRLPDAGAFAGAVAAELGASEGTSGRDLLLLHLDLDDLLAASASAPLQAVEADAPSGRPGVAAVAEASAATEAEADARWDAGCEALEWVDSLLRGLMGLPEIRERTLLVLMLSPAGAAMPPSPSQAAGQGAAASGALLQPGGAALDPSTAIVTPHNAAQVGRGGGAAAAAAAAATGRGGMPGLSVLDSEDFPLVTRPAQSFEFLGLGRVAADPSAPVLVARRLPGVVRRDRAEVLSYREALAAGGQGAVLLDRLLPEVAYKVGRAPKYGA